MREGKLTDENKSGLVEGCNRKLIELYRRTGRRDELCFELEHLVFELHGDMDDVRTLNGERGPQQRLECEEDVSIRAPAKLLCAFG